MADFEWFKFGGAAFLGGLVVKLLDIGYQEIRNRSDRQQSATRFVDEHLDPLLKAADELVAKIHSLAREDFKTFTEVEAERPFGHNDVGSTIYLFSTFWGQLEIIRRHGLFVALNQDERGKNLQSFISCIESTSIRLIDRISQRAIGEVMLDGDRDDKRTLKYIDLVAAHKTDESVSGWLAPLVDTLLKARHTVQRQQLIQYATIVHAMIDTLDPAHDVSRRRPPIPNKLSERTRKDLHYRVFRRYLGFVADHQKYIGRPKDRAAGEKR